MLNNFKTFTISVAQRIAMWALVEKFPAAILGMTNSGNVFLQFGLIWVSW